MALDTGGARQCAPFRLGSYPDLLTAVLCMTSCCKRSLDPRLQSVQESKLASQLDLPALNTSLRGIAVTSECPEAIGVWELVLA